MRLIILILCHCVNWRINSMGVPFGVDPWCWGLPAESVHLRLTNREIIFKEFQPVRSLHLNITDRWTDRRLAITVKTVSHQPSVCWYSIIILCPSRLPSRILNLYWIKWALAFVLVSSFSFFVATCATLSWSLNFWVHVKLFFRISYVLKR